MNLLVAVFLIWKQTLQSVEEEKEKAAAELQERQQETLQLQEENKRLSETTFMLQTGLEVGRKKQTFHLRIYM